MLYIIISWLYPNKSYLSIWFDFLCCSCFLIFQHLQGLQRPEPPRSWKPLSLVRRKLDESARININHCLFWGDSALFFTKPHVARCRWVALHIFLSSLRFVSRAGSDLASVCWTLRKSVDVVEFAGVGYLRCKQFGKPGMDPGAFMRLCVLKRSLEPGFFA